MKKSGWILLISISLFSTSVFSQMPVPKASGAGSVSGPDKAPPPAGVQSLSDVNLSFLKQRNGSMEWGRDPFVLPSRPTGEPHQVVNGIEKPFSLSAIIFNSGTGAAIINGRIVRKGSRPARSNTAPPAVRPCSTMRLRLRQEKLPLRAAACRSKWWSTPRPGSRCGTTADVWRGSRMQHWADLAAS